ncbi:hypothetical protein [Sutcliffiella halmapala]|uniref:hypothetical protein n=1 Tax=Sutcliffiella halmapala TaxID=79882 RepID=UPI000994F739|nr:hypothetical protein [Sutcliffiella halmapala]
MVLRKKRLGYWLCLVLSFFVLSGCNGQKSDNNYYLLLMGESENWNLSGYEIVITPEEFKAGYGTLNMKNENEYITDSFHFVTYVVINDEDTVVHSGSETGEMNIAEKTTGAIEGKTYLNENGDSIKLNEISEIYVVVEWWDIGKSESVKERIDLYNKDSKEQTFLNE